MTASFVLYADHGACVSIFSAEPFAGSFSVTGAFAGPGTNTATIRTVVPIAGSGSWSYCAPGIAEARPTVGAVVYAVHAHSASDSFAMTHQCLVRSGVRWCV